LVSRRGSSGLSGIGQCRVADVFSQPLLQFKDPKFKATNLIFHLFHFGLQLRRVWR